MARIGTISTIDLIFATPVPTNTSTTCGESSELHSDSAHTPIVSTFELEAIEEPQMPKWKWLKMSEKDLREELGRQLQESELLQGPQSNEWA